MPDTRKAERANRNVTLASPTGGRLDAAYKQRGDAENAGELLYIGNAIEGNQQQADETGRRKHSHAHCDDGAVRTLCHLRAGSAGIHQERVT